MDLLDQRLVVFDQADQQGRVSKPARPQFAASLVIRVGVDAGTAQFGQPRHPLAVVGMDPGRKPGREFGMERCRPPGLDFEFDLPAKFLIDRGPHLQVG